MKPKANRLLLLLVGAMIAGCSSQTERSSSGAGAEVQAAAEAAPQPAPSVPAYEPEPAPVQYVDRPLEETPPPKPQAVATAPKDEPTPDFPITKYELPPDESVGDLGTQADESVSVEQQPAPPVESTVGEPTEFADDSEEVEDLGTQEDESVSAAQEPAPEAESTLQTTEYPDEEPAAPQESAEVEDLGTQPDDSGTVSYPEEQRAAVENGVSEPTIYPDEPVPAAPTAVSVNFEADPLFNFDKALIRADQQAKLDELVSSLNGTEYDELSVIGHADRIGPDAYNQKLSERRAKAVQAYLVEKGLSADRIRAEGRGKSEPVTGDACARKRGKALISCLQPDRRVDVSVSAIKRPE
jgi:outer membrane protein OmpA-like peptidoglycan-associated protein